MPTSTSGTIGSVTFTNQVVIDHAFLGVKLARQQISEEYILTAQEQLALMLSSFANEGVPLWCQTKYILPMVQGVYSLDVSQYFPGLVDILEANLRYCAQLTGTYTSSQGTASLAFDSNPLTDCTQTSAGGNITMQLATAQSVQNFGLMSAVAGTLNVSLQYSNDGVTWTTFYTNAALAVAAQIYTWMDFQGLPAATYWRLQANGTTVLNIAELFWGNTAQEIQIARINKDDYWNLPNKTFQGRPVQYWCDRQINGPIMNLWPAPAAQYVWQQITVLAHRHIMDVGSMTQQIEAPQRAFDMIWKGLSERLRMVIPEVDKTKTTDVPAMAAAAKKLFWSEERDDSPINLQIDLSPYTK